MGCCLSREDYSSSSGGPQAIPHTEATLASAAGVLGLGSRKSKQGLTLLPPPPPEQILPPYHPGKSIKAPILRSVMNNERETFFGTRTQGDQRVWQLIESTCFYIRQHGRSTDVMAAAAKQLSEIGLTCPSGQMWDDTRDMGDRERNRIVRRERRRLRESGQGTGATTGNTSNGGESADPDADAGTGVDDQGFPWPPAEPARVRGRQMPGLWDKSGSHYFVPLWCLGDPANITEDTAPSAVETVNREVNEKDELHVNSGLTDVVPLANEKSPVEDWTELSVDESDSEKMVTATVRQSDKPKDLKVLVNPDEPVRYTIARIRKAGNVDEKANVRLIHGGHILERNETLAAQGWTNGIIQAFVIVPAN